MVDDCPYCKNKCFKKLVAIVPEENLKKSYRNGDGVEWFVE